MVIAFSCRFVFAALIALILPSSAEAATCGGEERNAAARIRACSDFIANWRPGTHGRDVLARAYLHRAIGHRLSGNTERALADLASALENDPNNLAAAEESGNLNLEAGRYERAVRDFSLAIKASNHHWKYLNLRAWTYFKMGKAAQGLPDAEAALSQFKSPPGGFEVFPQDRAAALDTRGHIYEALGRRDAAIADFKMALSFDPDLQESKDALRRLGIK